MVLGISGVVWSVRLVHTRLSCPFGLWVGLATFEIYPDVSISSQFFQQISSKVVFFLLGAFQALGRCILFHILCLLLLPQLFFGLLRENVIVSLLLLLSTRVSSTLRISTRTHFGPLLPVPGDNSPSNKSANYPQ